MTLLSCSRWPWLTAAILAITVGACGAPRVAGGTATPAPTASATASPPAPPSATASLGAALTTADIVNSGYFSQSRDGLLGGLANSDARVFVADDSSMIVEVDLVTDTGAGAAALDYPPYQSAAAKQAAARVATSSPGLGQQSNEYDGVDAAGKHVVSISFVEGRYIAVVTAVGAAAGAPDIVKTSAESIAQAQDNKINSMGS